MSPKTSTEGPTGELEGGAGLRPAPAGRARGYEFGVCDHITSVHMRDFFLSQFPRFVFRFMHFTLKKIFVNKKKSAQSDLGKVP